MTRGSRDYFRIADHPPRTREPGRAKHVMIVPFYSMLDDVRFGEWLYFGQALETRNSYEQG
jgi:hypothetical protein